MKRSKLSKAFLILLSIIISCNYVYAGGSLYNSLTPLSDAISIASDLVENKLPPIEDTFVSTWNTEQNGLTNGVMINMLLGNTPLAGQEENSLDGVGVTRDILLKYDLSEVTEEVVSAKLYMTYNVRTAPAQLTLYPVGNDWGERTTNYTNRPKHSSDIIASVAREYTNGQTITDSEGIDITEYFKKSLNNEDKKMSLYITNSAGGNHMILLSKEVGVIDQDMMPYISIVTKKPLSIKKVEFKYDGIYEKPPIAPIEGHPRVFLTKDTLPEIKERFYSEDGAAIRNAILSFADQPDARLTYGVSNALIYLIDGDVERGKKAVDIAWNALNLKLTYGDIRSYYNIAPQNLVNCSVIYDWCYDLISDDMKAEFIRLLKLTAAISESGYPPVAGSAVVGHMPSPILRGLLSFGIAVYDEDPEIYDLAAGRLFQEIIPARNWLYQSGGLHYQGMGTYGLIRMLFELYPTFMYRCMGYDNVYTDRQNDFYYQAIYARVPSGAILKGDDNGEFYGVYTAPDKPIYSSNQDIAALMLIGLSKNPYYRDESLREWPNGYTGYTNVWRLLFDDLNVKPKSVTHLPLTRYFGSPSGTMVARTGWDDDINVNSDTAVAIMNITEYNTGNHKHLDGGGFQLYYRGNLAIDSGAYYDYNSPHQKNYGYRTIAHNTILVHDPDEKFSGWANDGGQRIIPEVPNLEDLQNDPMYKTGEVLYADYGPDLMKPDYTYLKGDIAAAYSKKVKNCERSFVFVNMKETQHPAALVVFDRVVSSDSEFKKTWLLHTVEEPEIDGTRITALHTDGYTGKMVNDALLPKVENLEIKKVFGNIVDGKDYPSGFPHADVNWRVEISPKQISEEDLFLNVMQAEDASTEPLPVEKIENDIMVGTAISNQVIMFSKTGNPIDSTYEMTYGGTSDEINYIITDVKDGTWEITNNDVVTTQIVQPKRGVLYVKGKGGKLSVRLMSPKEQKESIFTDISNHWSKDDIESLEKLGIFDSDDTAFRPNDVIDMESLLKWTLKLFKIDEGLNYIDTAYKLELIDEKVCPKSSFDPQKTVTREEMASIAAKAFNAVTAHFPYIEKELDAYEDRAEISDAYAWGVKVAKRMNIMNGTSNITFSPHAAATRAQAAAVANRLNSVVNNYLYNKLDGVVKPWEQN